MSETDLRVTLEAIARRSPFHMWAGFALARAADGFAELTLDARSELRQHAGSLHAGVTTALLDTACGYAAASLAGAVTTTQMQTMFLSAARGERFVVRARVVKNGKRQIFTTAELFDIAGDEERLVAHGTAVLVPVSTTDA